MIHHFVITCEALLTTYYVISHLTGGILKTWKDKGINFPNSAKFTNLDDAIHALDKGLQRRAERYERTGFHCDEEMDDQYVIMKYSGPYRARIVFIREKNTITWL